MKLKPTGYNVLIEIFDRDGIKSNVIEIPKDFEDSEIAASDVGYIRAIGPSCFSGMEAVKGNNAEERLASWGAKIGDKVEFTRYDGKRPASKEYENFRFIQDQHIIAVMEED